MTFVSDDLDPTPIERLSPTEDADIDEIKRGMLAIQAQAAAAGNRPPARGTHAKGTCVRAAFEVLDVRHMPGDPAHRRPSRARDLCGAGHLSGCRAIRERRWRPSTGPLAGRAGAFVCRRCAAGSRRRSHPPRFFDEQRQHVSDQRRARVRSRRARALGARAARQMEGAAIVVVARVPEPASRQAPGPPAAAGHTEEGVPVPPLLEHRSLPLRASRRDQVFSHSRRRQSGATASIRSKPASRRARATR